MNAFLGVSWFRVIWKNSLGELATVTPQVEAVGIVPRLGRGTGPSSQFRAATGNVVAAVQGAERSEGASAIQDRPFGKELADGCDALGRRVIEGFKNEGHL